MSKEPSTTNKAKTCKPAGKNDTPRIVSAVFALDERDKEINLKKRIQGKPKTVILGSAQREMLSTELTEGMIIPVIETNKTKNSLERDNR